MTAATNGAARESALMLEMPDPLAAQKNGEPAWKAWQTERAATRQAGTSNMFARRLMQRVGTQPFKAPDGTNRYWPALVVALTDYVATVQELVDDEDAPGPSTGSPDAFVKQLVEALKQAQAHNERLVNLICGPVERILSNYDEHQGRLEARNARLEQARDDAQAAHETQLERIHERELETKIVTQSLERKTEMFAEFKKRIPGVLDKLEASVLFKDPNVSGAASATLEFLKSLQPIQLAGLLAPDVGFLSPEQQKLIRKVLDAAGIKLPGESQDEGAPAAPAEPTKEK